MHKLLFFYTILFLSSCTQADVFEKNTVIPGSKWKSTFNTSAAFNITDTSTVYKAYVVLRHTDYYKYNNIWLQVSLQRPADSALAKKIELTLGNDAGGWEGKGISDIWEVRKLVFEKIKFPKTGTYTFGLSQIMRDDPLPGVISAGIHIEKTSETGR